MDPQALILLGKIANRLDELNGTTAGPIVYSMGAPNYIPKYNTATSLTPSIIYDDGISVGIGTNSPSYTLDIQSYNGPNGIILRGTGNVNVLRINPYYSSTYGAVLEAASGAAHTPITISGSKILLDTGNVLIGTTVDNTTDKLQVAGSALVNQLKYTRAIEASNSDLNLITDAGFYNGANFINGPNLGSTYAYLTVQRYTGNSSYAHQIITSADLGKIYTRVNNNNVWTAWAEIITTNSNPITGTGTTNYITKWGTPSTLVNSLVYDNGTNVMIGSTTDYGYKFQVKGTTLLYGNTYALGEVRVAGGYTAASASNISLSQSDTSSSAITVYGNNASTKGALYIFQQTSTGVNYTALKINNGGNVLIGTTTDVGAGYLLQVNGAILSTGLKYKNGLLINGIDLNSITEAGFYQGFNLTNAPLAVGTNNDWYITVEAQGASYVHQTATSFGTNANTPNRIFSRINRGGWTAWAEMITTNNGFTGTGTANYLPKFTSVNTIGNSLVYDNGTNVGIGYQSGDSNLTESVDITNHISGVTTLRLGVPFTTNGLQFAWNNNNGGAAIRTVGVQNWQMVLGAGNNSNHLFINGSGNITIGTGVDNGIDRLQVVGSGLFTTGLRYTKAINFTGDLNNLINAGFYDTVGSNPNLPIAGEFFYVTVQNSSNPNNDQFGYQTAITCGVNGVGFSNRTFTRSREYNVWTPWVEVITTARVQNSMAIDGTGTLIPTVDAVNAQANNLARAVVATGFLDTTDSFRLSRIDDFTLGVSASQFGVAFSQRFKTPPFAPSDAIENIAAVNIPLSAIGLTGTGTAIKFVGYRGSDNAIVFSDTQFIQSPSVAQLGIVLVKFSGGVTSFIDATRTTITIPDVAAYSNLDTSSTGVRGTASIAAIPATLSHSTSPGRLIGISVAWGTSNNDVLLIAAQNPASFTRLHPGNALTATPPAIFTTLDPTQYWNGTALTVITGSPNQATVQRLLMTIRGTYVWQYGEMIHTNFVEASNNILQETFTNILPEGTFAEIGRMAITVGCTRLDSSLAQYYPSGSSGGGSGGSATPTAWGAITGSLDDQLDLKARLDAKVNKAGDTMTGSLTATSLIKTGGLSTQFLKADGSIDSTLYANNSNVIHTTGNESKAGDLTLLNKLILSSLTNIDLPAGITALGSTGNTSPINMVLDSIGNVFILSQTAGNITKITPAGVVTTFISGLTGAPSYSVIDKFDNLYLCNSSANTVSKITPAGVLTLFANTGTQPLRIAIDTAGNLYTANGTAANITKITPAGVTSTLGVLGTGSTGIVLDTAGNIYTCDSSGAYITKTTPAGASSTLSFLPNQPNSLIIDSLGNLYTSTTFAGDISKTTPAGVTTTFATIGTRINSLGVDNLDNVYAGIYSGLSVSKITPALVVTNLGTVTRPLAMAVSPGGIVFVTGNQNAGRVDRIVQSATQGNKLLTTTSTGEVVLVNPPTPVPTNVIIGTGTTNYLPKFTTASTLGNSALSDNGTVLNYDGGVIRSTVFEAGVGIKAIERSGASMVFGAQWSDMDILFNSSTANSTKMIIKNNGNVLIGTTTDAGILYKLQVNGDALINGLTVGTGGGNVSNNTALGKAALGANTTAFQCTAVGYNALAYNTTGQVNSAFGERAMFSNTTGLQNTGIGVTALYLNTTGSANTGIGAEALLGNSTGSANIGIGYGSGSYLLDGTTLNINPTNSTYIGSYIRSFAATQTNEIIIGYTARGLGSNSVVLGNDSVTKTALKGNVLIGTTFDNGLYKLSVFGNGRLIGVDTAASSGTGVLTIQSDTCNMVLGGSTLSSFINSISNKPLSLNAGVNRVLIGTEVDNGTDKLQVTGSTYVSGPLKTGGMLRVFGTIQSAAASNVTIFQESADTSVFSAFGSTPSIKGTTIFRQYSSDGIPLEAMRIVPSGNILMGTSTDDGINKLQVNGYTLSTGYRIPGGTSAQYLMADGTISTGTGGGGGGITGSGTAGYVAKWNSVTGIANAGIYDIGVGNVIGVGTTTPRNVSSYGNVTIDGVGGSTVHMRYNGAEGGGLRYDSVGLSVRTTAAAPVIFEINSSEKARVSANGNFLVGSTSEMNATDKLQVTGTANIKQTNGTSSLFVTNTQTDNALFILTSTAVTNSTAVYGEVNSSSTINYCYQAGIQGTRGIAFTAWTATGTDELIYVSHDGSQTTFHQPTMRIGHVNGVGLQIESGSNFNQDDILVSRASGSTGNPFRYQLQSVDKATLDINGNWTAGGYTALGDSYFRKLITKNDLSANINFLGSYFDAFGSGSKTDVLNYVYGTGQYQVATNNTVRLTVSSGGNVVIGTTDNGSKLRVGGSAEVQTFKYMKALLLATNTNPDTITDAGFYEGQDLVGAPLTGWFYLTVETHNNDINYCHQTITEQSPATPANHRIFSRIKVAAVWQAWRELVTAVPYKKYVAIMSQSGTAVPTVTVLENTVGNIVWSYLSTGNYAGTLTGAFPGVKNVGFATNGGTPKCFINVGFSTDAVLVVTNSINGVNTDGLLSAASIEIRVYQ